MTRVFIKTYGCQMNKRDSEAIADLLLKRGYFITYSENDADIVLLNTCSVREQAEKKAIGKAASLLAHNNSKLILGVMGCMAQNRGTRLLEYLPDLKLLVGTHKLHTVPDYLDKIISNLNGRTASPIVDLYHEGNTDEAFKNHYYSYKNKSPTAFVKIMQGCNMKCSYCIVPKTRGKELNRPINDIISEIRQLANYGVKEVTLLGQIVNHYGIRDIPFVKSKSPFVQLLDKVNDIQGIKRIRFTSPHPIGFRQDLIDSYGRLEKLCEYVHLPMQSGSNKILKAMYRPYTIERFANIVERLRKVIPYLYLSTDVIVGFPGETQYDFDQTVSAFQNFRFDMAFIYQYSPRPGTKAEYLGKTVTKEEKLRRNKVLLSIMEKLSLQRNSTLIGTIEEVLVEGRARKGENMLMGHTRGYRKVIFPGSYNLIGRLLPIYIQGATNSSLLGTVLCLPGDSNPEPID